MRALSVEGQAAIASGNAVLVQLIKIDFPSDIVAINTSSFDIPYDGVTYAKGVNLAAALTIQDQPGELQGVKFTLNGGPVDLIALALDESDQVQGTLITIRTALLAGDPLAIVDAPIEWAGFLDTMTINEDGEHASIEVTAESKAVDLLRSFPLTTSDADQQMLFPGDRAYEYVADQQGKPVTWPAKDFFYQ